MNIMKFKGSLLLSILVFLKLVRISEGGACWDDTLRLYINTADLQPNLYDGGETIWSIVDNKKDSCTITPAKKNTNMIYDCNAHVQDLFFAQHQSIQTACDAVNGKYFEIDQKYTVLQVPSTNIYDIRIKNIPICFAKDSCEIYDAKLDTFPVVEEFNEVSRIATSFNVTSYESKIRCNQEEDAIWTKVKNTTTGFKIRDNPCSVLENMNAKKKARFCNKRWMPDIPGLAGKMSAGDACPATCGRCDEGRYFKFFLRMKENKTVVSKSCKWLQETKRTRRKKICRDKFLRGPNDEPSAWSTCPDTCATFFD